MSTQEDRVFKKAKPEVADSNDEQKLPFACEQLLATSNAHRKKYNDISLK